MLYERNERTKCVTDNVPPRLKTRTSPASSIIVNIIHVATNNAPPELKN